MKGVDVGESMWGLCIMVMLKPFTIIKSLFLTDHEIYKTHKGKESIFELEKEKGYKLKSGIEFHFIYITSSLWLYG